MALIPVIRSFLPTTIVKWIAIWTAVSVLYSMQLRWHYGMPWSSSVFWGFTDWYLWSLLALAIFAAARKFYQLGWSFKYRLAVWVMAAPVAAAAHVILTMIVGGADDVAHDLGWSQYFTALYGKKLTLNLLTFGALAAIGEFLIAKRNARTVKSAQHVGFLAKRGDVTRMLTPDDLIFGEVSGNYVELHTQDGVWAVHKTLTQMIEQLPSEEFLKVNRSRFVRLASVHSLHSAAGKLTVRLLNGTELSVARRQQALVRKAIRARATS